MPPIGPRWAVSYRPKLAAHGNEIAQLPAIAAESWAFAIKQAQMILAGMDGGPFKIIFIDEIAAQESSELEPEGQRSIG